MAGPGKVAVIDTMAFVRHANGAAYAEAARHGTSIGYEKFVDDSEFWNWVVSAMVGGAPGYATVNINQRQIDAQRERIVDGYIEQGVKAAARGYPHFCQFMSQLEHLRQANFRQVQQVFRKANQQNQELDRRFQAWTFTLATVKLVATVSMAVVPVAAPALGAEAILVANAGKISFIYGLTKSAVTAAMRPEAAHAVAFSTAKQLAGAAAEKGVEHARHQSKEFDELAKKADARIERYSRELARDLGQKKKARFAGRLARAEEAEKAALGSLKKAKLIGHTLHAATVVFAADDVIEAVMEFKQETGL
jgi:hypothetical protein